MDGIELALRFSYITNKLRYCGPEEAAEAFMQYIKQRDNAAFVQDCLKRFEGLYPYLSAIADKHGKSFTDYDVIEAYWIGNSLLDAFTDEDNKAIIKHLGQRGLPASMAAKLIEHLPSGLVPHHNFNVYYVGVGNTSGKVATTLPNMDNCRISYGKVVEVVDDQHMVVMTRPLREEQGRLYHGDPEPKTATYFPDMVKASKGDTVALHWGFVPCTLSNEQKEQLDKYDTKLMTALRPAGTS